MVTNSAKIVSLAPDIISLSYVLEYIYMYAKK